MRKMVRGAVEWWTGGVGGGVFVWVLGRMVGERVKVGRMMVGVVEVGRKLVGKVLGERVLDERVLDGRLLSGRVVDGRRFEVLSRVFGGSGRRGAVAGVGLLGEWIL